MTLGPAKTNVEEDLMELSELVACTLTSGDHKTQKARWKALCKTFGLERAETTDGIQLRFRYDPGVEEELRALVAVENECCSWAAWDVSRDEDALVMAARSKGEGIKTLHGMFTKLA
jgi:hypothetical protein